MIDAICKTIGCFVLSAVLFAIPVLTTCSFALSWDEGIQFMLCIVSMVEYLGLSVEINRKGEEQ